MSNRQTELSSDTYETYAFMTGMPVGETHIIVATESVKRTRSAYFARIRFSKASNKHSFHSMA